MHGKKMSKGIPQLVTMMSYFSRFIAIAFEIENIHRTIRREMLEGKKNLF